MLEALDARWSDDGWFGFTDHLLGYPVTDSFGYGPRPEYRDRAEGQWLSLLTVDSHDELA